MDANEKFRAYTLPKDRRRFWAIVQTFAIPLALPLAIVVCYLFDSSSGYYNSAIGTSVAVVLWGAVVSIPYNIRFSRYYKNHGYQDLRRVGWIFVFIAPFLYVRNLYLIIKQED
jgi:Domain of unknown function (DUF2427).